MDINMLTQLIGSLGFPIVCCAYLFWENHKQREKHAEKEEQLTEALNNNTLAIEKMITLLSDKDAA